MLSINGLIKIQTNKRSATMTAATVLFVEIVALSKKPH
jgi:hypothetical protein